MLRILPVLLLAGCSVTSERVVLQNSAGDTKVCGPYEVWDFSYTETSSSIADRRLRQCITDYQRQGYERK